MVKLKLILVFLLILNLWIISPSPSLAWFSDTTTLTNQQITTACWANPNPVLLNLPSDNNITNSSNINFSWSTTTSSCSIATLTYKFQIYTDLNFNSLYTESNWTNDTTYIINGIPEGEYWWKVQAKDQFDHVSSSSTRHLIIDRISPSVSLEITGSSTKEVTEKIDNGDFESGNLNGWTTAGEVSLTSSETIINTTIPDIVINPYSGSSMVKIGHTSDPGNLVHENRLMKSLNTGAKSLSFYYNFLSKDYFPYDNPGFFVRLNGQDIFNLNPNASNPEGLTDNEARQTTWQQFTYDLSDITTDKTNLAIYAGNNPDISNQSWVYLDKITTYFITASDAAVYHLSGTDTSSGINYFMYKIDSGLWTSGNDFHITSSGDHNLEYYAVDNAGNSSPIHLVKIITDTTLPSSITDLSASDTYSNSITLTWTAPGNNGTVGRASQYNIRYQKNCSNVGDFNFDTANLIEKVPAPQNFGQTEYLDISGLDSNTSYCFALRSLDEAPNDSTLSNILITTTDTTALPVSPGDLIINELMWPGTNLSSADEYLELRNLTDHVIDLSNFKLTKLSSGLEVAMLTIPAGKTIPAHGYFLIGNNSAYTQLKNGANLWSSSLTLSNTTLQIKLYDNLDNLLDSAWDETSPTEGLLDPTNNIYYSMERVLMPGDGTNPLNWYTTIDEASRNDFFQNGGDVRGTPGAENRSDNAPFLFSHPSPSLSLTISPTFQTLSFTISHLNNFTSLSYELSYDTDLNPQGVLGQVNISNQSQYVSPAITLGTCSSGGTCVYHTGIKNINLKANLEGNNHMPPVMLKYP